MPFVGRGQMVKGQLAVRCRLTASCQLDGTHETPGARHWRESDVVHAQPPAERCSASAGVRRNLTPQLGLATPSSAAQACVPVHRLRQAAERGQRRDDNA